MEIQGAELEEGSETRGNQAPREEERPSPHSLLGFGIPQNCLFP